MAGEVEPGQDGGRGEDEDPKRKAEEMVEENTVGTGAQPNEGQSPEGMNEPSDTVDVEEPSEARQQRVPQQQGQTTDPTEYDLVWPVEELPSRGLLYDFDEVWARRYKFKEAKHFEAANRKQYDSIIRKTVQSAIQQDFMDFTYGDKLWIHLLLRIESWSETTRMTFTCSNCEEHHAGHEFPLSQIELERLPEDYTEPRVYEVVDGRKLRMTLFRVRDESRIDTFVKQNVNKPAYEDYSRDELDVVARLAAMLEIGGEEHRSIAEKIRFFEQEATNDEYQVVRGFADDYYHGLSFMVGIECRSCGFENRRVLKFRPQLLYPDPDEMVDVDSYDVTAQEEKREAGAPV